MSAPAKRQCGSVPSTARSVAPGGISSRGGRRSLGREAQGGAFLLHGMVF
jgi:hypothetical protein